MGEKLRRQGEEENVKLGDLLRPVVVLGGLFADAT